MIIRAHSVPILTSGLSKMQERLLRSKKFVRLVSAPTGSGKSYAFMRAVFEEDAHVLFIVPTKRLLQNLIDDSREQARKKLRECGLGDDQVEMWIDERIIEWSGNQDREGGESLVATRVRQFLNSGVLSGGHIIFAIPEVVVTMISGIRITGASTINPFLYLRRFDHVVFDEFHTIDDRSFGLACLFSLLAVIERQGKVSFLSATPIDVTKVLEQLGVEAEELEQISEKIVTGHHPEHRPIHGDVALTLSKCSLSELIHININAVRMSIASSRTVIVIFDSLERLKQEEQSIRGTLSKIGVQDERILMINSIDDSMRNPGEVGRRRRYADPHNYDVLLCTSSVENGVTFCSTLMFMEPGFRLASFVQRVGRVSRGVENGRVIVSLSEDRHNCYSWTRTIKAVIDGHKEMDIQTFTAKILADVRHCLRPTDKEVKADFAADGSEVAFYRRASWRGAFWAALFIVAVRRTKMEIQKEANKRLRKIAPNIVKFIEAKIEEILSVEMVDDNLPLNFQPHKLWVNALLSSALTYRDIGATVEVINPDGKRHTVKESFLRRATDILNCYIAYEEEGEWVIQLKSRTLDQEIRKPLCKSDDQMIRLDVRSPINHRFSLLVRDRDKGSEQLNVRLVEQWRYRFAQFITTQGDQRDDPRNKVMRAATALVERLGRPPLEEDYDDSTESAMFT